MPVPEVDLQPNLPRPAFRAGLRFLTALLVVLGVLVPGLAHATTVAVLEFDKGAAGEAYDGLGKALAGMIVSDLAGVDQLTLVERDRLDEILAEIELGKTELIDPKTAAKVGKGAGAEVVLLGSYSVVEGTLALDARLVDVQSSKVLEGATASGAVADFVTVEKDLVEALIAELDVTLDGRTRRTLYSNVPTEDWEAFTAFSRARARASEGELEEARKAFEEALAKDPAFTEAATGLANLNALIKQTRQADRETFTSRYDEVENAVLAKVPDVRTRKKSDPWTLDQLTEMAVRFTVLHNRQRHCDRYAEMMHYLDLVEWDPKTHEEGLTPKSAFGYSYGKKAEALGIERWSSEVWHPEEVVHDSPSSREGALWRGVEEYLFDRFDTWRDDDDSGVFVSLVACYPEPAVVKELERWRKSIVKHGLIVRPDDDEYTLLEQVDLLEAWSDARDGRMTDRSQTLLADLVARFPDPEDPLHRKILRDVENITRRADNADRDNASLLGLSRDTIRERLLAIDEGKKPFTRDGQPWCGPGFDNSFQKEAHRIRLNWDEEIAEHDNEFWATARAAQLVRSVGDMGCLQGVKARYTSWDDVVQHAKTARTRKHPTKFDERLCTPTLDGLDTTISSPIPDNMQGMITFNTVKMLHHLHQTRCLVEAR